MSRRSRGRRRATANRLPPPSATLAKEDQLSTIRHQTVSLGRGKHASPEHGACVMELSSMLAGEPFTDHPRTVSRSLAAFLRSLNDLLDDPSRQRLYAFAATAVGTAGDAAVEAARAERLLAFGDARWAVRANRSLRDRLRRRAALERRRAAPEAAARYAIGAIGRLDENTLGMALALAEELIAMGSPPRVKVGADLARPNDPMVGPRGLVSHG